MTITALRPQKRNPKRISVFVDGRYSFSLDQELALQFPLKTGDELDEARRGELLGASEQKKAMDAALKLLSFRSRSLREMSDRLKQRGFNPAVIDRTKQRLTELGLLDDLHFAQALARDRLGLGRKGKRQIYADLRKKGVPKPLIETALAQAGDEEAAARALLAKVGRRYAGLAPRERYRKLHDLLLRRGFSFNVVSQALAVEERTATEMELQVES
jgi:regulatory protein